MILKDVNVDGKWVMYHRLDGIRYPTLSGVRWLALMTRTKVGGVFQRNHPTYTNCVNAFTDFQEFVEWSIVQYGYDLKDESGRHFALDKDIIIPNNTIYSKTTCCFIPGNINRLLVMSKTRGGALPIGVVLEPNATKFKAKISINGRLRHLGYFTTAIEAHRAWQVAKFENIREVATRCVDLPDVVICGLHKHADLIFDDWTNHRMTIRN